MPFAGWPPTDACLAADQEHTHLGCGPCLGPVATTPPPHHTIGPLCRSRCNRLRAVGEGACAQCAPGPHAPPAHAGHAARLSLSLSGAPAPAPASCARARAPPPGAPRALPAPCAPCAASSAPRAPHAPLAPRALSPRICAAHAGCAHRLPPPAHPLPVLPPLPPQLPQPPRPPLSSSPSVCSPRFCASSPHSLPPSYRVPLAPTPCSCWAGAASSDAPLPRVSSCRAACRRQSRPCPKRRQDTRREDPCHPWIAPQPGRKGRRCPCPPRPRPLAVATTSSKTPRRMGWTSL